MLVSLFPKLSGTLRSEKKLDSNFFRVLPFKFSLSLFEDAEFMNKMKTKIVSFFGLSLKTGLDVANCTQTKNIHHYEMI